MVRTRVGYAGGEKENPTYYSLGDHSETIQIDYDPTRISYEELLAVFWDSHNTVYQQCSRQYMSIIFYHNEEQRRLAVEFKERKEASSGVKLFTEVIPFSKFYLAEDYHQKYYLRQVSALMKDFNAIYPAASDFVSSTAAARVNGYVGGYGTMETLQEEFSSLGLSEAGEKRLLELAGKRIKSGCALS